VFDRIAEAAASGALGNEGKTLSRVRVTLSESDVARASYEGPISG